MGEKPTLFSAPGLNSVKMFNCRFLAIMFPHSLEDCHFSSLNVNLNDMNGILSTYKELIEGYRINDNCLLVRIITPDAMTTRIFSHK